ncbi:MAG: 4-hydroxyphenylpyruvate dioxygenase [Pseudomonadota bacterium]
MGKQVVPEKIENHTGLRGIEFIEFSAGDASMLDRLFTEFGFSRTMTHSSRKVDYYNQNDIHFLVNLDEGSHAVKFARAHGPCVSAMGWRVENAVKAQEAAVKRGARAAKGDYNGADGKPVPAIYGIGDSLIYFIDGYTDPARYKKLGFKDHAKPNMVKEKGFLLIDHLTNNVEQGAMKQWSEFYKNIFGFYEVRYFDIRGEKTGLTSYALRSPDGSFCIPINEGTEKKSQINEYLEEYKGPGVQHIAFQSRDIVHSLRAMKGTSIQTLDIDADYYSEVFNRVPNVTEDHKALQDLNILIDGDDEGYLLQIFTKNIIGPIFIEIIQRKNHHSFGEGNFGALFRSIERDQQKRGYLK